jgi:hypothetical protein
MNPAEILMIEDDLLKMPFVQWDRFFETETGIVVFGWIKRKDTHEDFVLLNYRGADGEYSLEYSTSSAIYSKEIAKLLQMEEEEHSDCERIESVFKIHNMIKLSK